MNVRNRIIEALSAAFEPSSLQVVDESEKHIGHVGWREGGETHFRIRIAAARFDGMSRLERHRAVYAALSPDPLEQIHALALNISGDRN